MAVKSTTHRFFRSITLKAMNDKARENYDKIDWSDDGKKKEEKKDGKPSC